jgi:glucosamine--fructose-6-phosphate aminotransferase (isomerizing)
MSTDLSVVQGGYLRDLLSQPDALQDTVSQLQESKELQTLAARLHKGKFKAVVLTGMGSSYHALNPLLLRLTEAGFPAILAETSELIYYRRSLLNAHSLIVAVSQSGQSVEMIRLLEKNRGRAALIAVTNTAASPLAKRSDAVVLTRAGEEFTVSCKTYVTALVALKFLGDRLCRIPVSRTRRDLHALVPAVTHYLAVWENHVQLQIPKLCGIRQLFLAGRGPSLAAAGTGALILKESTQFPAEGLSSASFRHGPFEMLGPETLILIFAGDSKTKDLNQRLAEDIQKQQGRVELIATEPIAKPFCMPQVPASLLPVVEILPIQMLTLALAAMVGREPGKFRFATKITTTE